LHHVRNGSDPLRLVDLVGKLGDDDTWVPGTALWFLDCCYAANHKASLPAREDVSYSLDPHQDPTCREIGSGQRCHQLLDGDCRIVEVCHDCSADFTQVVRGHLCCH